MTSPYDGISIDRYLEVTEQLVEKHPLSDEDIIEAVLDAWSSIFRSRIGDKLIVGEDITFSPQIMGNFLHELIPLFLSEKYPDLWRKDRIKSEKDLVYIPSSEYSAEIKTSSSKTGLFANRSYGQLDNQTGKSKSGYYIGVNFEKFKTSDMSFKPEIKLIRFGWLDHSDWIAQESATGQSATLNKITTPHKLLTIYNN